MMWVICMKNSIVSCFKFIVLSLIFTTDINCCGKMEKNRQDPEYIIKTWTGREIKFPEHVDTLYIPETYILQKIEKEYKILFYADSSGCMSCRLQLNRWSEFISELDSAVQFLFYFQPKDKKNLLNGLQQTQFRNPVHIDMKSELNKLNSFPSNPLFQCFLLDKENKVLVSGNPVYNPKIWDLYKEVITGKPSEKQPLTTVEAEQIEIELKDLQVGKTSEAVFRLKNTGNMPLAIIRVESSCGCTVPEWEKQPVAVGKTTEIKVKITPEKWEFFHKTVTVHCNTEKGRLVMSIKGSVEK